MSVLVLMYHHTPSGAPETYFDVSLAMLRDQIRALQDAGFGFIRFSQCNEPRFVNHGVHVALTFDDGHATNDEAFRFLSDNGVTPAAMIVKNWSERDARYLSASALRDLNGVCDFGAHGVTHNAMTKLSDTELAGELAESRDYIAGIAGAAPSTMAFPGGHGGARELAAAERAGFSIVGNSRSFMHRRRQLSVNRVCINRTHDVTTPLRLAQRSGWTWAGKEARFAATAFARRALPSKFYGALTTLAKWPS